MKDLVKPDLKRGVPLSSVPEGGRLLVALDGEEVLLVPRSTELCRPWASVGRGFVTDSMVAPYEQRAMIRGGCRSMTRFCFP